MMIDEQVTAAPERTTAEEPVRRRQRATSAQVDPLARLADQLRRLVKEVGATPKPRAVHQLRTTIRRFEALLPEPEVAAPRAERKVCQQLDHIRKRAGKVRDADVHLLALRGLGRTAEKAAHARVQGALETVRSKRQKRLVRTLADERDRGLFKRLRTVVGHAATGRPVGETDEDHVLAVVLERFAHVVQTVAPLGAANLHEFRIRTKRLRYLAETAAPSPAAATTVAQLKRVQDAIGTWHDWLTLLARTEKILAGEGDTTLLAAMRARTQVQLQKAVAVTTRVAHRLAKLRLTAAPRKGARPIGTERSARVLRSAGASA